MNKYVMFLPDNLSEYLFVDVLNDSDFHGVKIDLVLNCVTEQQ